MRNAIKNKSSFADNYIQKINSSNKLIDENFDSNINSGIKYICEKYNIRQKSSNEEKVSILNTTEFKRMFDNYFDPITLYTLNSWLNNGNETACKTNFEPAELVFHVDSEYLRLLLIHKPFVADENRDNFPWEKISGKDWSFLLARHPQFASYCNWNLLNDKDWDYLVFSQYQFKKYKEEYYKK